MKQNEPFILEVAFVRVLYHNNEEETKTLVYMIENVPLWSQFIKGMDIISMLLCQ